MPANDSVERQWRPRLDQPRSVLGLLQLHVSSPAAGGHQLGHGVLEHDARVVDRERPVCSGDRDDKLDLAG